MANPAIQAFFKQVQTDAALREKMRNVQATNPQEAAEALVQIAREVGHVFTARQYLESVSTAAGPPRRRIMPPSS